jgi:hypothetical protein
VGQLHRGAEQSLGNFRSLPPLRASSQDIALVAALEDILSLENMIALWSQELNLKGFHLIHISLSLFFQ